MIEFVNISSNELDSYIKELDDNISYINNQFGLNLKSYGNILRIALNATQVETVENLINRLNVNKELERALDDAGGYTIEYLGDNNPKVSLSNVLYFIKENQPKQNALTKLLKSIDKKTTVIIDNTDLDFMDSQIRNRKVDFITFSALKKKAMKSETLVFASFNGQKDFDYLYNLNNEIKLVVYEQEKNLYQEYLNRRKELIETEIKSGDRIAICGLEYKEIKRTVSDVGSTINGIVSRLDEMNGKTYEGYKDECDLLLDEIDEKLIYKVSSDKGTFFLESNDTVFTNTGELIKAYKVKVGNKIRLYPKEQLAENLYQVAVETEPDIFGVVEEHANFWKQIITDLRSKYGNEQLYSKLQDRGLKVLPNTLNTYGKGFRKFPMYKKDLRAIFRMYYLNKSDNEIDAILQPVLKSKTTYNSTMIVLGRGLKQELRLFLKQKIIGDILKKRNFNKGTLEKFINDYMPVHTISDIQPFGENIENIEEETLSNIEL